MSIRYEKAERLLNLALEMQASRGGVSLAEMQRSLGVGRRTAERMRDAIRLLFPMMEEVAGSEREKRWRLPVAGGLASTGATADDLSDLELAIRLLETKGLKDKADRLRRLSARLRAALPASAAHRVAPDLEAMVEAEGLALRPGPRPRVDGAVVGDLRAAILACRKVRLHHCSRETGARSRQLVAPYGFLYGSRHYLVAWTSAARDYRLYSLPNIARVETTDWTFERRKDFSLADYAARSFGVFQDEPVDVVWRFSPGVAADAREFLFHPTQTMEEREDGSLIVRFRACGLREMSWELFRWGAEVEVVAPISLKEDFHQSAQEILRGPLT